MASLARSSRSETACSRDSLIITSRYVPASQKLKDDWSLNELKHQRHPDYALDFDVTV